MKQRLSILLLVSVLVVIGCNRSMPNESREEAKRIKNYLSGEWMMITYRNGGALYGTYYFRNVHFCASGQFKEYGQSRRQTVLDNEQVYNWTDAGTWDVVAGQGEIVLRFTSTSGEQESFPASILGNGKIWLGDGVSVVHQGQAECR